MTKNGVHILTESVRFTAAVGEFRAINIADGRTPLAGQRCDGFSQCRGEPDDIVPVVTIGTTTAIAGAEIAKGDLLEVGDDGKLVPNNGGIVVAIARGDAQEDGDELLIKVGG